MGRIISSVIFIIFIYNCSNKKGSVITISSDPEGSKMWVDGVYKGVTPRDVFLIYNKEYKVSLIQKKFYKYENTLTIKSSIKEKKITYLMNVIKKKIQFKFNVEPDKFYIDGEQKNTKKNEYEIGKDKVDIFIFKDQYPIFYKKNFIMKDKNHIFLSKNKPMGKIIFKVNIDSRLYVGKYYIKDMHKDGVYSVYVEANRLSNFKIKPIDSLYFEKEIIAVVGKKGVKRFNINLLKEKEIIIKSNRSVEIKIFSKTGEEYNILMGEDEKTKIKLYEKNYIFYIRELGYDTMKRLVNISDFEEIIEVDFLLNRSRDEKNRYRKD